MSPLIHVVDDDRSVRTALTRLLRLSGYQTQDYCSAGEFLMRKRASGPGCIVLDVRMPGPSGLELHEALCRDGEPLPVIFLTGHGDIPTTVRAMKSGAVDFLTKPVNREDLMAAIERAVSIDMRQRAADEKRHALRVRFERLTGREREVFAHVATGKLNKQIAAELGTSERTIKAHRAQVMDKMCARSIAELVRAADQLGNCDDPGAKDGRSARSSG